MHCGPVKRGDGVQQHHPVVGQHVVGHREEVVVALVAEVLERADGHDPVDGLVPLFPALQQHPPAALGVHLVEHLLHVGGLVLAQRQPDDVDAILLDRPAHGRTPAAADVEQRHARLKAQLAQRQVDLGDLCLFQRHVVAFEVGAAVGPGGVEKQREELVGQVVMGLHVFKMRLKFFRHVGSAFPRFHAFTASTSGTTPPYPPDMLVDRRWPSRKLPRSALGERCRQLADHLVPELLGQLVAHALEGHQSCAADGPRHCAAARGPHQLVGQAVDDHRGRGDLAVVADQAAAGQDRAEMPGDPPRVVAAFVAFDASSRIRCSGAG